MRKTQQLLLHHQPISHTNSISLLLPPLQSCHGRSGSNSWDRDFHSHASPESWNHTEQERRWDDRLSFEENSTDWGSLSASPRCQAHGFPKACASRSIPIYTIHSSWRSRCAVKQAGQSKAWDRSALQLAILWDGRSRWTGRPADCLSGSCIPCIQLWFLEHLSAGRRTRVPGQGGVLPYHGLLSESRRGRIHCGSLPIHASNRISSWKDKYHHNL